MKRKRAVIAGLVALAATLVAFGATHLQFFETIFGVAEQTTMDWRQRIVATELPRDSSEIRLILFDEESVGEWPYEQPFPRNILAELIQVSSAFDAAAIGVDVYLERLYPELEVIGGGDQALRDAIARAGNVILAAPLERTPDGGWLAAPPDTFFANVAAGVGYAEIPTAFDVVSEATLFTRTENLGLVPGFALAIYAQTRGLDIDSLMSSIEEKGHLDLPGMPRDYGRLDGEEPVHNMGILFAGPPSRPVQQEVSAAGEVEGDEELGAFVAFSSNAVQNLSALVAIDPSLVSGFFGLQDKAVMLGSGFHAEEKFKTPFYSETDDAGTIKGWMFGTEVHANALENLLTGTYLRPLSTARTLFLLFVLAAIVAAVTFWRGATWGVVAGLGLLAADMLTAVLALDQAQLHVPIVGPGLAATFAFLGSVSYVSIVEGREKRVIRGAFSKYLSPIVVDELVNDPSRLKLGGEKRHLSILFSDLAGFTSLSESLEPEALLALLNEYLDDMADIVMSEGGTLDKYIGDAIMALYNAPAAIPDHAIKACRTALRMQRRLDRLNEEWVKQDRPHLGMRIGINTGYPVVGNIGGEKRFDYTALGDAVNLAARLEPACKTYGVAIMISGNTRDEAGDAIVTRELELLAVYGKEEPVPVYELVALAGEDLGEKAELIGHYEQGIAAYRNRDFELAIQYFQAAAEVDPTDGPTALYLERCRGFIQNPPPAEWDGVERRQVK